jgi:hypothetical protein
VKSSEDPQRLLERSHRVVHQPKRGKNQRAQNNIIKPLNLEDEKIKSDHVIPRYFKIRLSKNCPCKGSGKIYEEKKKTDQYGLTGKNNE